MKALIFALLCLVFSPLLLVGTLVFAFRVRFVNMPRGISGTAYEPYMARLALHLIGSRRDDVSERIAPHLPALSPLVMRLSMRPTADYDRPTVAATGQCNRNRRTRRSAHDHS